MYGLTVTTPPTVEPVSLARAKTHLKIDHDEEDLNIATAIVAARKLCETHSGRFFLEQTVLLKLSGFPSDGLIGLTMFGANDVTAVEEVAYFDTSGVSQVVDIADYQYEFSTNPPLIATSPGGTWPSVEDGRLYPVSIELTVGAASAAELDERVMLAILITLRFWINDDLETVTFDQSLGLPLGAKRLLDSIWTGAYVN